MATQVSLNSGAVASAGALALQTNGTTAAITLDTSQNATFAGKVTSAGALTLASNGTTTAATIDTSGNLGLGVTPSAWVANQWSVFEGAYGGALAFYKASNVPVTVLTSNAYNNGSWKYKTTDPALQYEMDGNVGIHKWYNAPSGTGGVTPDTVSFTQAMTLDASGNLFVGKTSGLNTERLLVARSSTATTTPFSGGGSTVTLQNTSNTNGNSSTIQNYDSAGQANAYIGFINVDHNYAGAITFGTATSGAGNYGERARIDSSGNLLVGATSNSTLASAQGLYLRGTGTNNCVYGLNNATTEAAISLALFYSSYSTANETKFEVTSEGNVKSRTNSYAGFSDERLKQNITPAKSQWNDIKNIEVVKFQMKSEQFSDDVNPYMIGVIAQQVEQVSPGLVDEDVKDGMKTVKYSILYMKAVKALQEAMARIEQLETRITALEGA